MIKSVALAILALSWQSARADGLDELEQNYNRLHRAAMERRPESEPEQAARLQRLYLSAFAPRMSEQVLRKLADGELSFALKAADLAAFHSFNPTHLRDMQAVLGEIERRGLATESQRVSLFEAAIGMRDFDLARELSRRHPALPVEAVPSIEFAPGQAGDLASAYRLGDDPERLQAIRPAIDHGTHIIVIAHPLCRFSRRAMIDLQSDALLAPVLARHAIWLAPVDRRLQAKVLIEWNREHPATPLLLARRRSDWPLLEHWSTPNFYLLRDGQVIGRVAGWPSEGNRDALRKLLASAGLLAPDD